MMKDKTIRVQDSARIFIGFEVPANIRDQVREKLRGYSRFTKKLVPEENWHVTVLFVGEVAGYKQRLSPLGEGMPQAYLPILSLTHIGRGLQEHQLWAFAKNTELLNGLQRQLMERLDSLKITLNEKGNNSRYVPHIKLAELRDGPANNLLADVSISAVWRVEKLNIYRSDLSPGGVSYSVVEQINLSL
jgi:2'-5' RNA ligase